MTVVYRCDGPGCGLDSISPTHKAPEGWSIGLDAKGRSFIHFCPSCFARKHERPVVFGEQQQPAPLAKRSKGKR